MFEHLQKLDVKDAQSWMSLPEISPRARVLLKPAGETNKIYYSSMLRLSGARARTIQRTDMVRPEDVAENRADDRLLFPLYVIIGWKGIEDDQGQPVEFNRENCKEFCEKIPHWIFDRVRNHAATPERFLGEDEMPLPEVRELVKNSDGDSSTS